tara:strand:- start:241 stop:936 length:696 start_codon:yes stop_codon:yes gene_type:complete
MGTKTNGESIMPKIYGNLVAYYHAKNSANEDAIKWFLQESTGKCTIIESITETDFKKFTGLSEAIDIAKHNAGVIITNEAYKIDDKLRPLTLLLEARSRLIGIDWSPIHSPVSTLHFLRLLRKIAERKKIDHSERIKEGQKRARKGGKKIGNTKGTKAMNNAHEQNKARWSEFRLKLYPEVLRLQKEYQTKTMVQVCELLEERNVLTFTGKSKWYPSVVRDIINEGNKAHE